jgi:hypothetical protein
MHSNVRSSRFKCIGSWVVKTMAYLPSSSPHTPSPFPVESTEPSPRLAEESKLSTEDYGERTASSLSEPMTPAISFDLDIGTRSRRELATHV